MESSNPILGKRGAFSRGGHPGTGVPSDRDLQQMYDAPSYSPPRPMTIDDVVLRTAITLGVVVAVGTAAWVLNLGIGVAIAGALVGLGLALFISFKRKTSPALVLAYAAAEGLFLGVISHYFAVEYSGSGSAYGNIVAQAVLGTVLAFVGMLVAYSTRMIRVTPKFAKMVIGALFALFGLMIVNLLVALVGGGTGIGIRDGGPLAIVFSLAAIAVGCLILALDFAMIEEGVKNGAPEREAWLAAFGLTVTLVWIYLEILRLLSYFRE